MFILDWFFLKYAGLGEGGSVKLTPFPPEKTTFKNPSLIMVKNKYYKKSKLLFIDTGSLIYEMETEDVYEDFCCN